MNMSDLADVVAESAEISKTEANSALGACFKAIQNTLENGGKVAIPGFGSFETSERAARDGRNPQTGEKIKIPAATVAKFKPGKALKEAVNQK